MLAAISARDFINRYREGLTLLSREISGHPSLIDSIPGRKRLLDEFSASFGASATLNLLSSGGQVLASSVTIHGLLPNFNNNAVIRRDLAHAAEIRGLAIGTPLMGPILHRWVMPLRLAIHSPTSGLSGYLAAPVSLDLLLAKLKRIRAINTQRYPGEVVMILRENGIVLARSPHAPQSFKPIYLVPVNGPLTRAFESAPPDQVAGNYRGVTAIDKMNRMGRWQRTAGGSLVIGISVPVSDLRHEFLRWLWPVLAGLVFALGCLAWAYGSLTRLMRQRNAIGRLDSLTGLANRRGLFEHLETVLSRAHQDRGLVAVVMFDLDGFKPINDKHGHACGDHVLRTIGTRLSGAARAKDFVARLGGDEFVLVVEELSAPEALPHILDRLVEAIEESIILSRGIAVRLLASGGAAFFPHDGVTADELLARADQALYAAKRNQATRKHCWALYDPQQDHTRQREAMLQLLRSDGLRLHYQPVIHLDDDVVVEMEALVRLADGPELLSPANFLPAFTTTDRLELAIAVLGRAAHDLASWTTQGFENFGIAVNVEPDVLVLPDFMVALKHTVKTHRIAPERITIEILESGLFNSAAAAKIAVAELQALGTKISLDDVGSGYSSLARLKELPIEQVKLDQSFVADLIKHPENVSFIIALQLLTKTLEIQLVVEGVDQAHVLDALHALGVDCAQGYLLARPMPAEAVPDWLIQRNLGLASCKYSMSSQRQVKTLFGAYVTHLLNRSILCLSPSLLTRLPDLGDSRRCQLGQYLHSHGLEKSELGDVHNAYHRSLTPGQFDRPVFQAISARLSQLVVTTIAANEAMALVTASAAKSNKSNR